MSSTDAAPRFEAALEGLEHTTSTGPDGIPCVSVERDAVHECLERLRDRAGFASVTFVTAIDSHPREPRFEVAYQLLSMDHNDRVRVLCRVAGDDAHVPSCTDLWPGASFSERECFDMFGIEFDGHPDLRRLLMPQGFDHHPLRKDYPHAGIQPDRLYREWDRERRKDWEEDA